MTAHVLEAKWIDLSRRLLAASCFVLMAAGVVRATSYTYVGLAPTGQQTKWANGQNWSPNGVPGANDDATIDSASSNFFPVLTSAVTIKNLTIKNGGSITGGTVTVNGTLAMTAGGFIDSNVFANGGMLINSAPVFGDATLRGTTLTNNSTARIANNGSLLLVKNGGTPAIFRNAPSAVFEVGILARIIRQTGIDNSQFENLGFFRSAENETGDFGFVGATSSGPPFFINFGELRIENGSIIFDAPVVNHSTLNSIGATIRFAGQLQLEFGARLAGSGTFEVNGKCFINSDVSATRLRLRSVAGGGGASLDTQSPISRVTLSISNLFEWQGGTIENFRLTVDVAETLNISGDNLLDHAFVENRGTANLANGAKLTGRLGVFNNHGTMNLSGGVTLVDEGPFVSVFDNMETGIIRNINGETNFGWPFHGGGRVETLDGTLRFTGAVTSANTFSAAINSIIEFNGFIELNAGARLNGEGLFLATGSGEFFVNADVPVTRFQFNGSSKKLRGTGRLIVSKLFDWQAGNMTCNAAEQVHIVIESGADFEIPGGNSKTNSGCVIDNSGTANISLSARLILNEGAAWKNLIGGTTNLSSPTNQGFFFDGTGTIPSIFNGGVLNVDGDSTSPEFFNGNYIQTGTLNVAAGETIDFGFNINFDDGALNLANNVTMRSAFNKAFNLTGGELNTGAVGTFVSPGPNGAVNNTGAAFDINGESFGNLDIVSKFMMAGEARLNFDIGGTSPGTQHDRINVSDSAVLGGTIDIQLKNFVPQAGNTFQLIPYGSRTGAFNLINGLNTVGSDRIMLPRYNPNSFSVETKSIDTSLNVPTINSAVTNANGSTVLGNFNGPANTYNIFLFTNPPGVTPTCNNANQSLVATTTVTTNGSAAAPFNINLAPSILVGQFVTAIASPTSSNTASQFSQCVQVTTSGDSIQFSAANIIISEADGHARVTVTRTDPLTGEASVDYATTDGTATERKDYTAALGRIRFAAGENSKTFDIVITDEHFDDDGESFNVILSNPVGATLGGQTTTSVNITDNDAADGPSPVREASLDTQFFVRQHYADFLNREPDQDGLNFWVGQMTGCGAVDLLVCRVNVSAAFFLSIENQESGYLTHRAYKVAYGNLPNKPVPLILREYLTGGRRIAEGVVVGQGNWQAQLEANKVKFFDEFVTTSRFVSLYGAMTQAQYVDALNVNAGGALSQPERDVLVNGTLTRAQILRAVAEDPDFAQGPERNRAFVLSQYFGYLRRNPDDIGFDGQPDPNFNGYNFWLSKLNQFNGNFVSAEMVKAFLQSSEFADRFGR